MSFSHPDVKSYSEIKQELLDAGFTEEWIEQNYPSEASSPLLEQMAKLLQQQGAGIPQMNYTNLTGFLDNYIQSNTGEQYDQLRTYLSNQGYSDKEVNNIIRKTYGPSTIFDPLPGGVPDPRAGIGLQAIQFLSGAFGKFFGPQGSISNFAKNQKAFKASKPERTRYEVDIDPNDPNEYIFDPYDAAEGKLSTKAEYQDRLNEFSQFNYNPETSKYDAYFSPRPLDEDTPGRTISQIREGLSDRELQAFEGLNIMPEGSSFDITDGATIYYDPGEDERSQQEIDAATINILERSNPKTSSDPSTIYFDPVYGKSDNSTPITSPPINPNEPSLIIDRLGGPVYQKSGSLPMAQFGIPYAPFEEGLTYELPEELQPIGPQAFSTPDMGYDQPQITEGKKQFGDRFLNFLQSPTAGLMGDIGSTAVGFARFMNPFLRDIQAKRQEEELERFGMADNITPLDFSEFPTKGIQSTRSNLLGPESARYTYLNYGRRGTEINDSREVEVDEETLLQLKKLGAEIEIL